ncbi:MAG TPA: branched-chain amino acid ABC transporter permease [Burkholderiales bacterium]|nr:branched-chain amino acid ABC transporter permease [Burkholderiales bacterium]HSA68507.1 branched-chain amino acid ABC transporter permease [Burkholderiales bacterium]
MQDLLELSISATASGCIYALVALAYLLMIRPTGIINFAVGEWALVGAFGGFLLLSRFEWPYPLGMAAILGFMLLVGWATERITVRPLVERGAPLLAPILALLGMLVVFRESISLGFGPDPHQVPEPVSWEYLKYFMIGTTLLVFAAVWLFFERTVWGKSFEAVALNRKAAALVGIDLARVTAASFAGGAAAAGLAGLLVAPNVSAHYLMGVPLAIQGFTALVIGGVGRVEGALLGGLLVAFVEQLTVRYAPLPAGYAQGVPLVLLMLFLLVRPTGLLRARG